MTRENYRLKLYAIANEEGECLKEGVLENDRTQNFLTCLYPSVSALLKSEEWRERPRRAGWKIVKVQLVVSDLE